MRKYSWVAAIGLGLVTGSAVIADSPIVDWKPQHVAFTYMGRTARYSCDGLRDKVQALLLDLGARRDMRIVELGCEISDQEMLRSAALNPGLSVDFNVLEVSDSKSVASATSLAPEASFVAFKITSDAFRNMGVGDCELVEEFTRQILPKLTTRNVKHDITCIPHQLSGSHYWVSGEVLKPITKAP